MPDTTTGNIFLGEKTIGTFTSIVYTMNNLCGPGMLGLSLVYQQSGWLLTTILILISAVVSGFAATMLCESMALIPGNSRFQTRYEFATIVKYYYGPGSYWICQVVYNFSLTILNIASILVCAQVMDSLLIFLFGASYALELAPVVRWLPTSAQDMLPFEGSDIVLSLGYLVTMIILMPMGFFNLDESAAFQLLSWIVMVASLLEFTVQFFLNGMDPSLTATVGSDFTNLVGLVIFGFAYVVTVPSWCNEKRDTVSVNRVIWSSTLVSSLLFIAIGLLGAWAYPGLRYANLLTYMAAPGSPIVTQVFVYLFSLFVIGLGIPLFAIYIRLNLYVGGVCNAGWSTFWGAVFPWLFSWLLYDGDGFTRFENWAALIINGLINFVAPFIIFLTAKKMHRRYLLGAEESGVNYVRRKAHPFEHLFTKPLPSTDFSDTEDELDDEEEIGIPLVGSIIEEDEHRHRAVMKRIERRIGYQTLPIILATIISIGIILAIGTNIWVVAHGQQLTS